MGKTKYIQYYVEGQCEEKMIQVLKTDLQLIKAGHTQVFNVMDKIFSNAQLMTLKPNTVVVLVFDTDVVNIDIFRKNIELLQKSKSVCEIVLIPQVKNFEHEMRRALGLKNIIELYKLFDAQGSSEFKRKFIKTNNLSQKLVKIGFSFEKMWEMNYEEQIGCIINGKEKVKLSQKLS